jgi:hypothetical protein
MLRIFRTQLYRVNKEGRAHSVATGILSVAILVLSSAVLSMAENAPGLTPAWLGHARIAGAELFVEMTAKEIASNLSALVAQNVSVIEADSDLSRLLTDKEFKAELDLMRRYCDAAHGLGLKVLWYYPALEVLSPRAKQGRPSMYKMHPNWVQQGLDGKPNVFYGTRGRGSGRVHWVEPGTESAWMSIHSPYSDMFLERIRKITATGVDGIWLDVPLFNDIGAAWADVSPGAAAKFRADTGFDAPKQVNWDDPVWRRWIAWRYQEISNFISQIRDTAQAVSKDIVIVVETVTLDYDAATQLGLDGSTMKSVPGIIQIWEMDAVSDRTGMREARPDDWISLISMSKFGKAASGQKPSWMFAYGKEVYDGLLVMAEVVAAGNHPYETKIPLMTTTVGTAYRKRMFSWIKQQDRRLFESQSAAKVAVYYSPESRDYVDRASGSGLYATIKANDNLWWSNERVDSVYSLTYLAEHRGIVKWLVHNHVPFDLLVKPDANELSHYEIVIAPSLVSISDRDADLLDQYVAKGGLLIITGPTPTSLDELGNLRPEPTLKLPSKEESLTIFSSGAGKLVHAPQLLGKSYLTADGSANAQALNELIGGHLPFQLQTNAGRDVHIELRASGHEILVHLINPERLWNRKAPQRREVTMSLAIPTDITVTDVKIASPASTPAVNQRTPGTRAGATTKNAAQLTGSSEAHRLSRSSRTAPLDFRSGGAAAESRGSRSKSDQEWEVPVPFSLNGNRVSLKVPLEAYVMVVISTSPR